MSQHDDKDFYVKYQTKSVAGKTDIIDFSTDNGYLVYKTETDD